MEIVMTVAFLSAPAATFSVSVANTVFTPKVLTITNGDTVVWTNAGGTHTVSPRSGVTEAFCGTGSFTSPATCSYTFTNVGSFAYQCNIHASPPGFNLNMTGVVTVVAAPGVAPTVSITNPANNAIFATPATVPVGVSAADSDGSVANVQLLTNGIAAATNTVAPFGFTLSNLPAGNYALRARATDNQSLSTLSIPVNVRIVAPPSIQVRSFTNGPLQFTFNTVTGVDYVVEAGLTVMNVSSTSLITNSGTGGTITFMQSNPAPAQRFFRVRLQ